MNARCWISFFVILFSAVSSFATCKSSPNFFLEGKNYYDQQQYLLSSIQFKMASLFACDDTQKADSLFSYALAMNRLGEKSEVLKTLNELPATTAPEASSKANLFKYLELNMNTPLSEDQKKRVALWEHRSFEIENRKSPALAGALSAIIPGAGQAYVGAWQSAAYSFLINALFLSAALELQNKDLHASALTAGVVFSVTYIGGIISAAQSAKTYNTNQTSQLDAKMYQELFPELRPH